VSPEDLPRYRDLPVDSAAPPASSWMLWGDDDELGTINLLTPEAARSGLACARRGAVFALNWALHQPDPPIFNRKSLVHEIVQPYPELPIFDEAIHNFFPQASSQWDSLSHVGHPLHGYYNGRGPADFTGGPGTKNGIDNIARRGIAGRGVLLDMARGLAALGRGYSGDDFVEFTPEDLDAVREAQGVEFEVGDILLLRTGWMQSYMQSSPAARRAIAEDPMRFPRTPGVMGGERMAEYLWDMHFSAVAADNPAFEAWPHHLVVDEYLHFRILALLGIPIGEMWDLEALADDCQADGVYTFLLTSAPLNLRGGVGSPPNALAIK
jgi:kynurenine formamidase